MNSHALTKLIICQGIIECLKLRIALFANIKLQADVIELNLVLFMDKLKPKLGTNGYRSNRSCSARDRRNWHPFQKAGEANKSINQ